MFPDLPRTKLPPGPSGRRRPRLAEAIPLALALFSLNGCDRPAAAPTDPAQVVLRIGLPAPSRRTAQAIGPRQVVSSITNVGLIRVGRDGRAIPQLAERVEQADGGRTVNVFLRAGVRFHDGSPLTPEAVKASLDRSRATPAEETQFPMLRDIERIDTAGDHVSIRLKQPSRLLLEDLEVPITRLAPGKPPISAGGFFVESESADLTVLSANTFYHLGRPTIEKVHVKSYPTVRAAWTSLMRDEVDFLYQIPNDALEFVENEARVQVFSSLRNYVFTLVFNIRRPMFTSSLRRALNEAVDREAIVRNVVNGHGVAAQGPVWPSHYAYNARPSYRFDPERADRLLVEAGYPADRQATAPGRMPARLRFSCLIAADVDQNEQIAILLQKQFFDLGIDMAIETAPFETFVERVTSGNYDAVLLDLAAGRGLVVPYQFWYSHSRIGSLNTGYTGADTALTALRNATGEHAFRDAALQFQAAVHADPPAIFLFWPEISRAVSRRFGVPESDRDIMATLPYWRPATRSTTDQ